MPPKIDLLHAEVEDRTGDPPSRLMQLSRSGDRDRAVEVDVLNGIQQLDALCHRPLERLCDRKSGPGHRRAC